MTLQSRVDHLVVEAASLGEGLAWCHETFGFEPTSGGEHPLMGTHNRVFRVDSAAFPRTYFEIIAINPQAPAPGRVRWFDLDDEQMRELLTAGPRLIHFVASTNDAACAVRALQSEGIEPGAVLAAERPTPSGVLRWKITVRSDGRRLFGGVLPTIIEWGDVHPCDTLPSSGIALQSLEARHPQAKLLRDAYSAIGLRDVVAHEGEPGLVATFDTPRGRVLLEVLSRD